ncbi:MAG: hypothetical protein HOO96_07875 [Polyangiaceae bacterium]|nr:hypothetical protein [Polyangiaceae bacterium]
MRHAAAVGVLLVGLGAACSSTAPTPMPTPTPTPSADAGPEAASSIDSGPDAEASDAAEATSDALRVFGRKGDLTDDALPPSGPGIVLDGGFEGTVTRTWIHATVSGGAASRGDVVVLTPQASDAAGSWVQVASFHSAQTVALLDGATAADYRAAAAIVAGAEVVWFTGGDQAKYVAWKGTPLMAAVQRVYDRGGVVGGSSAGMIILGSSVNDATKTLSENITTKLAVADPYDPVIHFTQDILRLGPLGRCITDPHFIGRDRMGRLGMFMARQVKDGFATPDVLGIGVDDGAALAIDKNGIGRRLADGAAPGVYVVKGGAPDVAQSGQPLVYGALRVVKLAGSSDSYDFVRRCGNGAAQTFGIDGNALPPYPASVYAAGAETEACPP